MISKGNEASCNNFALFYDVIVIINNVNGKMRVRNLESLTLSPIRLGAIQTWAVCMRCAFHHGLYNFHQEFY